jgi:hypothetical protein
MALHVYGVAAAGAKTAPDVRGRGDAPVRSVVHGRVAAVVSEAPADVAAGRSDLLAHARVLELLAEEETILPMRFGMLLGDDEAVVREILAPGEERLAELLAAFDGCVQMSVKAYHHEELALRHLLLLRPDLRHARDAIAQGPGNMSDQVRLGEAVVAALTELQSSDAELVRAPLEPLCERMAVAESPGQLQVLDAALLVRRDSRTRLDEAVAELSRTLPERLRLRYVGPQPPYAFVEDAVAGEPVWA